TFEKCRKFGLYLNPKKSIFALEEGKLLGHIVSRDGVKIDPARVQVVQKIPLPRSKKDIQKFLGKINFLRRFVSNYVEIVKEITNMLKKGNEVHWNKEAKESFSRIKEALQAAPVLISRDYQKPFQVFSFASPNSIVVVLLQNNDEEKEQPVAFFSKIL
ncbi:ribonuclease H family protein, partial [Proteus mirabilis]|uniref:ribonuclease H family protein n=1 Tax=Proteus mirabilis TaxID=584 RepID=UPI0013A55D15